MQGRRFDLVCSSYLADAEVLHVSEYPPANGGAVVERASASIAGDGPLVATIASALGLRTGLIANPVGDDPAGHRLLTWLERSRITHAIPKLEAVSTPRLTVITDDAGTRTWFAPFLHTAEGLLSADLRMIGETRLVYVDCYRVLADAAARVVTAAEQTPLMLNLGSDPLDDTLARLARRRRVHVVQTSLDEDRADDAWDVAGELFDRLAPAAAVITLGRLGAVARTSAGRHHAPACHALGITHTHGAGAAFSAGYARALLNGTDVDTALRAGCAAGTQHCESRSATVPRQLPAETFA